MKTFLVPAIGLCIVFLFLQPTATAQPRFVPEDLRQRLAGKQKLAEIMQVVDEYYDNGRSQVGRPTEEEEANPYIHWKRWEWWMSSHLDGNGNFVRNIRRLNQEALEQTDSRWGNMIRQAVAGSTNRNLTMSALEKEQAAMQGRGADPDPQSLAYGDWTLVGPTAEGATVSGDIKGLGRMDRIAFHPTNANIIYVGAPSGNLWKTTDGGTTWSSVTDALANPGIAGVAVSPTNGNLVYILTGDGDSYSPGYLVYDYGSSAASSGVYKSTDGGATWTRTGDLYTGGDYEGHRLTISPSNGNYLFATTSQGVYRTTDGGTTWTQVKTGEHWDVEFKPTNDSVVYCTSGSAIFYSTQGGRSGTWNTSTTDFSVASARRIELAVTEANANYVYALCGAVGSSTFTGIFRSTNSGVDYTRRTNSPNILNSSTTGTGTGEQSDYDLGICVKQNNAEIIATAGLCVWRSNGANGGTSMVYSSTYREGNGPAAAYIHPDVHDVQYSPLNNNLFAATDGGFYRSTDDGVTWTNLSAGLCTSQFYGMAMRDADADGDADGLNILAGAQDNGMKYRPTAGGSIFKHVICCDGYGSAINSDNPDSIYYNINSNFYRSVNAGDNSLGVLSATFFMPVAIDFSDPDTIYLGGTSTRRSFNGFSSTNLTIATSTRRELTTCPSNQTRLYGSSGTNVVRSDDRIATWTTKSGNPGWPVGTFTINDIDVFPTNSLEVYACFGGYSAGNKVMRSTDGGDNWTNWTGSLPNVPTYSLAVATEGVYVGTEIGVFFRGYAMTDWVPFYNGMPRAPVTEIIVNDNGLVYASTFGRGIWLGNRRSACTADLNISGTRNGPYYYEASNSVTATITAAGSSGDEIFVQGGQYVLLSPGFEVKSGSYFKAYISPCSNGGIPTTGRTGADEPEGIILPRIHEVKPKTLQPALNGNYYTQTDGRVIFHIINNGKLEMQGKQADGSWKTFYPEQSVYPGFYYVSAPNAFTGEIRLLYDRAEMRRL